MTVLAYRLIVDEPSRAWWLAGVIVGALGAVSVLLMIYFFVEFARELLEWLKEALAGHTPRVETDAECAERRYLDSTISVVPFSRFRS